MKRPKISETKRFSVWKKTQGQCWYCSAKLEDEELFGIDHVVPISLGGTDDLSNLVPCCRSCNAQKKNMSLDEFRAFKAMNCHPLSGSQWEALYQVGRDIPERIEKYQKRFLFPREQDMAYEEYIKSQEHQTT